jgi:hypothetical protein
LLLLLLELGVGTSSGQENGVADISRSAAGVPPASQVTGNLAISVGSHKQLFIDYKFIESAENVELVMNPPARTGEVIIKPDAPWEKNLHLASYGSVLAENGIVRVWYSIVGERSAPNQNPDFMAVAYAESADGINFTKPVLDLVKFAGNSRNNLVLPTDLKVMSIGGCSVMRDDNPDCPSEERYKTWMKIYPKKGTGIRGPSRVWVSPDGLQWKLSERLVTGLRATDTQSNWFWDPRLGRYVGYTREWIQFEGEKPFRASSYNESDDMFVWGNMQIALEPDGTDAAAALRPVISAGRMTVSSKETWVEKAPSAAIVNTAPEQPQSVEPFADQVPIPGMPVDVYGPGVSQYTEAEDVYVSLTSMFYHWNHGGGHSAPDTSDVRLAVSRDGRHFTRPGGRKPFLSVGPEGAFDSRWLWPLSGPIRMGDELWIYYFGSNIDHSRRVGATSATPLNLISRAVMRLDGFVSADFGYTGGTLITPPLKFEGQRLELNLDTGAGGSGQVEILDAMGVPIPGFTMADADQLNGNNVRSLASWTGAADLSSLAGRIVRLHFRMRSAKLYAFQFAGRPSE